jgi:hypothetical protein
VTTRGGRGGNATWIVLGRPAEVARLEREVADLPRVGVVSLTDALDHIRSSPTSSRSGMDARAA